MSAHAELRIDFVSPLPPVRSGIADYSADLLPDLAASCDVRVVHIGEQPIADELVERWQPVGVEHIGEDGRLPLYQMGNNELPPRRCYDLALKKPGRLDPSRHGAAPLS